MAHTGEKPAPQGPQVIGGYAVSKKKPKGIQSRPDVEIFQSGRWVPEPKKEDEEEGRDVSEYFRKLFQIGRRPEEKKP
jgi:hypothetical protein